MDRIHKLNAFQSSYLSMSPKSNPLVFSRHVDLAIKLISSIGMIYGLYSSIEYTFRVLTIPQSWEQRFINSPVFNDDEDIEDSFKMPYSHLHPRAELKGVIDALCLRCPKLKVLNFSGVKNLQVDQLFQCLSTLKNLEELDLSFSNLTDGDIQELEKHLKVISIPSLERLNLEGLSLQTSEAFAFVRYFPMLKKLNVSYNSKLNHNNFLSLLSRFSSRHLEHLCVNYCPNLDGEEVLKKLSRLAIEQQMSNDVGLYKEEQQRFPKLKVVESYKSPQLWKDGVLQRLKTHPYTFMPLLREVYLDEEFTKNNEVKLTLLTKSRPQLKFFYKA